MSSYGSPQSLPPMRIVLSDALSRAVVLCDAGCNCTGLVASRQVCVLNHRVCSPSAVVHSSDTLNDRGYRGQSRLTSPSVIPSGRFGSPKTSDSETRIPPAYDATTGVQAMETLAIECGFGSGVSLQDGARLVCSKHLSAASYRVTLDARPPCPLACFASPPPLAA